jgi:hypothetical protein
VSKHLNYTPLTSSMLKGYHYDPAAKILTAQFHGGAPYAYAGVPQAKVDAMTAADSAGAYFAANIRSAHKATKLG